MSMERIQETEKDTDSDEDDDEDDDDDDDIAKSVDDDNLESVSQRGDTRIYNGYMRVLAYVINVVFFSIHCRAGRSGNVAIVRITNDEVDLFSTFIFHRLRVFG